MSSWQLLSMHMRDAELSPLETLQELSDTLLANKRLAPYQLTMQQVNTRAGHVRNREPQPQPHFTHGCTHT